jgi:hypothetical protein
MTRAWRQRKLKCISIFFGFGRLIFLPARREGNSVGEKMEAKVSRVITLKSEIDFYDLIEKRLEQQGFEVLETLTPQIERKPKESLAHRFVSRFTYE